MSTPSAVSRSARSPARLAALSDSVTRAPRAASSSAAATPLRAAPATVTLLPLTENPATCHRSFKVVRLNSAKMIATITNRVMTFGSLHPMSSKW